MATTAEVTMRLSVKETLTTGVAGVSAPNINHDNFKTDDSLTSTSTPAITQVASFLTTLSGGAATIDLTALTDAGGALDLTGLKVQAIYFKVSAGDSAMTFTTGASNGYNLGGDALFSVILAGGESACYSWNETSQDVAAGDKDLDIAGTGTDSFECVILAG